MYISERIFVIICSFLKPLGVLESSVRHFANLRVGTAKWDTKSCNSCVLNHTDWDSHHQTKMSPSTRKVVLVPSVVFVCWETVCSLVSTVCTTEQELTARNNCVRRKGNSEQSDSSWLSLTNRYRKSWQTFQLKDWYTCHNTVFTELLWLTL